MDVEKNNKGAGIAAYGKITTVPELAASLILLLAFNIVAVTALMFWAGISVSQFHFPAAIVLSLGMARYISCSTRLWLVAALWLVPAIVAGSAMMGWFYDFSGDGQWYHLPGIIAIAEGWNPFLAPEIAEWRTSFEQDLVNAAIYVEHYAKGPWLIAAVVYKTTGILEAGKVFNLLYMIAVYIFAAGYLRRIGLSGLWSHVLAMAAAFNPVSIYQMLSAFVDGQIASLCTLLVIFSLDYFRKPRPRILFLLFAAVVLLANTKFTGLVYASVLGAGFTVLAFSYGLRPESGRYAMAGLASLMVAVLLVGYQPYVTNLVTKGNPFYPAVARDEAAEQATEGQFDLWAPEGFLAMNRFEKMARSLLAESSAATSMPRLKVPFSVAKQELYIFFNTEPRYGGFGPFFGSVLVMVLVIYALARGSSVRKIWNAGAILALMVFVSVLPNPEAWWARLAPQFWLVPVILLAAIAAGTSGWQRRPAVALVLLLLVNSMIVAALNWGRAVEKNLAFRGQLETLQHIASTRSVEIATDPRFRIVTEHRLRENGIQYVYVEKPSCDEPYRFSFPNNPKRAQAMYCIL